MVVPQVVSEIYYQEWQTRSVYLIGSIAIILILNIDNFEVFQVSKEGVKFKKVLKEAKETASDIKTMLETTLLIQIKQMLITGGNPKQSTELYYSFKKIINDNNIENKEIESSMLKFRKNCLNSFILDLNSVFSHMRDPKGDNRSEITKEMSQLFDNAYSNDFNPPKPEILNNAFSEMKISQESFLKEYPDWKDHYLNMYARANTYIEKYEEFYNNTK